jgi:D-arabinose 1-dehydrogenase-like Zn-dependent alcohol dehydrogenase
VAEPGDLVAIQGLGGLGHLAVQFSKKFGFTTAVVSQSKDKENLAFQLGADYFIHSGSANPAKELKELGGDKDRTIRFSVRHHVLPMIETFPLEEAAAAYEKMKCSKVHFRSVLKMKS